MKTLSARNSQMSSPISITIRISNTHKHLQQITWFYIQKYRTIKESSQKCLGTSTRVRQASESGANLSFITNNWSRSIETLILLDFCWSAKSNDLRFTAFGIAAILYGIVLNKNLFFMSLFLGLFDSRSLLLVY